MPEERVQRRLAAILVADVVGYSRLVERDEGGPLDRVQAVLREVVQPAIDRYCGRIAKTTGDEFLVEFASLIEAVRCAVSVQQAMARLNRDLSAESWLQFRIGIHLGDIEVENGNISGDGVNVAVRLEGLAEPGGIMMSHAAYDHVRGKLPFRFDDQGEHAIRHLGRSIRVFRVGWEEGLGGGIAGSPGEPAASKPSIAVLPFANMSSDPEQQYFSDGLTEDIITALSRVSGLWVIARASTFTYKGQPTDVKKIAADLGVRYVMEGSVRRAGARLRVTAQLVDAATGHHVWAERYDRPLADLFEIQDEITRSVAASTQTQVQFAEARAAASRLSTGLEAGDLAARAFARVYDQTPEALTDASNLVEAALRIDPLNALAHRVRGLVFFNRLWWGETAHDAASVARAMELARTALRLAPRDEYAHYLMALAHAEAGQLEDAIAECERGLDINPNCSLILGELANYFALLGRSREAIEMALLTLRLNPRDPSSFWHHFTIATAHFAAADYEAALRESRKIARARPHLQSAVMWAAAAAALGRAEEAETAVAHCLAQRPELLVSKVVPDVLPRFARDADHRQLLDLLRQAGLPG